MLTARRLTATSSTAHPIYGGYGDRSPFWVALPSMEAASRLRQRRAGQIAGAADDDDEDADEDDEDDEDDDDEDADEDADKHADDDEDVDSDESQGNQHRDRWRLSGNRRVSPGSQAKRTMPVRACSRQ